MTLIRHPSDGRVHWSELKRMADCPAEYEHACLHSREATRPMIVGAVADCIVFGNRGYAVYDLNAKGEKVDKPVRSGGMWEKFKADHAGEIICNPAEYEEAKGAADAVLASPLAQKILDGCEFQKVMQWSAFGLECAAGIAGERGGVDAYHPTGAVVVDLKITDTTEPEALNRHAWRMLWHVQLAWYAEGLRAIGVNPPAGPLVGLLICVKRAAPHTVTVLAVGPDMLEAGRKSIVFWAEKLRACDETGRFPGYSDVPVTMTKPEWLESEGSGDQ